MLTKKNYDLDQEGQVEIFRTGNKAFPPLLEHAICYAMSALNKELCYSRTTDEEMTSPDFQSL